MAESVRVAVRVRPFNSREKERNSQCCLKMIDKMTQIIDPENPDQPPKEFSFDFSYWSHDQFEADENGIFVGTSPQYADQRMVFNDLGQGVLNNAVQGFNCSLFAYGQTGAGKSYSMVGYGPNKGIVPITCDELFKLIERSTSGIVYQVTFSMLEIYNEQVRDLLTQDNPKGGLPVRQNPKLGSFYVQGLKFVAVGSYKEIEARTEEGTANRTVASTQMNATSSRAHTVVTIQFDQIEKNPAGEETKKQSVINLVDLAGSERADSTGATGDRLKEGANINKSLSSLGNVISALADLSMGKKKVLVPYRDSVLTKLLQNALGGNSKTIMIAALSPADINYDETLGTLRYADRAKKIKNKAVVNENPMDKLIRELKEENEKLKKAMQSGDFSSLMAGVGGGESGGGMTEEEKAQLRKEMEDEIRAQLEANSSAMMNWDDKLKVARSEIVEVDAKAEQAKRVPHLVNLNEDPMLSCVILHFLKEGQVRIGRKESSPDIAMSGLSISSEHAIITNKNGEVSVKPANSGAKTKVNGIVITGEQILKHHDRLLFGSNHMYFFVNPLKKDEGSPETVDWEFANKEIAQAKGFSTAGGAGLSKDQVQAQEQVLELLPMVSEVNAISEELDKQMSFEVILISGAAQGGSVDKGTKVVVKMKNLLNDNVWLWERGKFTNRRYLMQDMYQRFLDGENVKSTIKQEDDPFWEPPEDVLIGTANVFLQSLSYALDFDDKLSITDYKGSEEGSLVISVVPCTQQGKALDEDYFVDDPKDLLGKPYHFKVLLRSAEVHKARYSHGLYVKFLTFGEKTPFETPVINGTLSPQFNFSKIISMPSITDDHLNWFEHGCLSFNLYGKQNPNAIDQRLAKMTTKELRQMESMQSNKSISKHASFREKSFGEIAQLKSEVILYKRRYERMKQKEKRIQDLVNEWANKDEKEKEFAAFHRAVQTAAFYERGKLKYKVNLLQSYLKSQPGVAENGGKIKTDEVKVPVGSKACLIQ
ncbi:kinesin-like protein KIF28 [Hydra vulgaris]|uniref:Kinesin-like protein n=1 Tax=Hydra vulgaris TaxID=6087 RepID=A0ABM4DND3_HYDVU